MSGHDHHALARRLDEATAAGVAIPQFSTETDLSLDDAYAVQRAGITLREARGERIVGLKLGFTSRAKAEQMGVSDVIIGVLTDAMEVGPEAAYDVARGVHPRVEPELAFLVGADVDPADPAADLSRAVTHVAPALEVIDSRFESFRFSLSDVVADNTSASGFAIGSWRPLVETDRALAALTVELRFDGLPVAVGSGAAILGDPLEALPTFQRMAAARGLAIPAGTVLLAGAATAAVQLPAATIVTAYVEGLGEASLRTAEADR
jgi:2-oxo-3-hexenedioate decarboxylase